jgi:hypothetical protein
VSKSTLKAATLINVISADDVLVVKSRLAADSCCVTIESGQFVAMVVVFVVVFVSL